MKQQKPPKKTNSVNSYARYSGIAIQMLAIIGLGTYGGVKLDEYYPNKYHVYTLVCSLAAIAIAMYFVVKQVSNNSKN
jgi:hypothetical protein